MKQESKGIFVALGFLVAFVVWTVLVCLVDVAAVGPMDSKVGFATINVCVHELTGVCMPLYDITDWLGLLPICVAIGFGVLGLTQWIQRKKLGKVDFDILVLGIFYLVVISVYILFECVVINYRPVLIEGKLEASYPSSTTMLVLCVMPTAGMALRRRIEGKQRKRIVLVAIWLFVAFMVVGRLLSGVHWFSDIVGGGLFSIGVVLGYREFAYQPTKEKVFN